MWCKVLVKYLGACFFPGREHGASTVAMVVTAGVTLVMVSGTVSMMDKRKTYLEIIRMQTRTDLLEQKLVNAATNMHAMEISARAAGTNSALYRCVVQRNCTSNPAFQRFPLHNPGRVNLSGLKTLSGEDCQGDCPIRVDTTYSILCGNGQSTCSEPAEIQTRYRIAKNSNSYFGGRDFEDRIALASLSTFVCEDGFFINSVTPDGSFLCDRAIGSIFDTQCQPGFAAYGLSSDGFIQCIPIVNYCANPLIFAYVLDTSSSMLLPGRITSARSSAVSFVSRLRSGDRASLTTFGTTARLVSGLSSNFSGTQQAINRVRPFGLTNMTEGLRIGGQSLASATNGNKAMIFLSDGHHNQGGLDPVTQARRIKEDGVRIFSVGVGRNIDRSRLRQIASSPADYHEVPQPATLPSTFARLSNTMCRN